GPWERARVRGRVVLLQGLDGQFAFQTRLDVHHGRAGASHRGLVGHVLHQRGPANGGGVRLGDLIPDRVDDKGNLPVLNVIHAVRPTLFDLVHRVYHEAAFGQVGGGAPRRLEGKAQFQKPAG